MKTIFFGLIFVLFFSCQPERSYDQVLSDVYGHIKNSRYGSAVKDIEKLISKNNETSEVYTLKGICQFMV